MSSLYQQSYLSCVIWRNGFQVCNFTKNNTLPWVFLHVFKFYKWFQITQSITYCYFQLKKWTVYLLRKFISLFSYTLSIKQKLYEFVTVLRWTGFRISSQNSLPPGQGRKFNVHETFYVLCPGRVFSLHSFRAIYIAKSLILVFISISQLKSSVSSS